MKGKERRVRQISAPKTAVQIGKPGGKTESSAKRRPPRTAAVAIHGVGEGFSYAAALRKLRENISLPELNIESSRVRKSTSGGVVIEIPGVERSSKADNLQKKVAEVLGAEARVSRPCVRGELRLVGLDDSVSQMEVAEVIADIGGGKVADIKTGALRPMSNGMFSVWVQCPLEVAIKASKDGKIKIGWTIARIDLLKARPALCYKCWEKGHVQAQCKSQVNRLRACYRCGEEGHPARACNNPISCLVCKQAGRDHAHRVGSMTCLALSPTGNKKRTRGSSEAVSMDVDQIEPVRGTGPDNSNA